LILGFGSTQPADIPAAVRKIRTVLLHSKSSGA